MAVGFSIMSCCIGSSKVRGIGTIVLAFSLIATFSGLRAQQNDSFRFPRFEPELGSMPAMADVPLTNFTSNLPIVILYANGRHVSKENPKTMRAEFFDRENGRASRTNTPNFSGLVSIHTRGSTTVRLPKQSYTFHTLDAQTNQTKVALLGLPKEEDWILYAPFEDKTMMRDVLAYELARKMGRYAPRTRYVELFVTNSKGKVSMSDYAGVYVLMEKIKRGSERVNIAKLTSGQNAEPDITGGYIIKRDHDDRNETRFNTSHGGPYFFVYPSGKDITPQQKTWLKNYFNSFESALYGEDFTDSKRGYAAFLDVDAFIDSHWLIEASKNVDGFRYSAYITKDRGGKIQPGPAWDWNRSFGNANYYGGNRTEGWYSSNLRPREISWYHRLREDPAFMRRSAARWSQLRQEILDLKKVNALVDQYAGELREAQARNFERWPILGERVTCNSYVGETWDEEVRWLKKWIENRINWIDKQVANQNANVKVAGGSE
jgi:hypothetical protein